MMCKYCNAIQFKYITSFLKKSYGLLLKYNAIRLSNLKNKQLNIILTF